jgi:hypothetical protein
MRTCPHRNLHASQQHHNFEFPTLVNSCMQLSSQQTLVHYQSIVATARCQKPSIPYHGILLVLVTSPIVPSAAQVCFPTPNIQKHISQKPDCMAYHQVLFKDCQMNKAMAAHVSSSKILPLSETVWIWMLWLCQFINTTMGNSQHHNYPQDNFFCAPDNDTNKGINHNPSTTADILLSIDFKSTYTLKHSKFPMMTESFLLVHLQYNRCMGMKWHISSKYVMVWAMSKEWANGQLEDDGTKDVNNYMCVIIYSVKLIRSSLWTQCKWSILLINAIIVNCLVSQ